MEVKMPVTGSVPVPSKWNKYNVSTENADTRWGSLANTVLGTEDWEFCDGAPTRGDVSNASDASKEQTPARTGAAS